LKLEQAVYGAVGGPHQGIIYSAAAAAAAFAANNSDNSTITNQSYSNIHQPPDAKRARIDVSPSSSGISPPDMAAAGLGGSGEEVYTNSMENGKIKTANSVDSLDNCSTVSSSDPSNQVRTLFVSGLPMDTKPRELYLLFRAYPGYESSLLKVTNKNGKPSAPVGFVTFATRQDADEARRKLSGVRFDPDIGQQIRLELARSNTKVAKPKQPSPPVFTPTLPGVATSTTLDSALLGAAGVFDQLQALEHHQLLAANGMYSLPLQSLPLIPGGNHQFIQPNALAAMAALQQQQIMANLSLLGTQHGGNAPCSTLFVANIGTNPCEDEMRQVFKKYSGFCRLRLNTKCSPPVAFVEFQDVRQATIAMSALQGHQLASSDRSGGLRIEYAKSRMGEGGSSQNSTYYS